MAEVHNGAGRDVAATANNSVKTANSTAHRSNADNHAGRYICAAAQTGVGLEIKGAASFMTHDALL